jgi:hypothetical protein
MTDYQLLVSEFEKGVIWAVQSAVRAGATLNQACRLTGVPKKTFYRFLAKHTKVDKTEEAA